MANDSIARHDSSTMTRDDLSYAAVGPSSPRHPDLRWHDQQAPNTADIVGFAQARVIFSYGPADGPDRWDHPTFVMACPAVPSQVRAYRCQDLAEAESFVPPSGTSVGYVAFALDSTGSLWLGESHFEGFLTSDFLKEVLRVAAGAIIKYLADKYGSKAAQTFAMASLLGKQEEDTPPPPLGKCVHHDELDALKFAIDYAYTRAGLDIQAIATGPYGSLEPVDYRNAVSEMGKLATVPTDPFAPTTAPASAAESHDPNAGN